MTPSAAPRTPRTPAAIVLGYLNFSSGGFDPHAWRAMSDLYAEVEPAAAGGVVEAAGTAAAMRVLLADRLRALEPADPAFRDARQAWGVLDVLFDRLLPAYRDFHADLLEHQPPGAIERPFFLMAAAQAVLAAGGPGDDPQAVVDQAIDRLNEYVGWRPVAVLENGRLSEPYRHERVRPVPLWMAGAGAAHGRYGQLVETAIEILREAPAELVRQADFDLEMLEELAFDPRAFDFLHPAASRPNYLFGLWDPARIDARGHYRRMVVQQATLDGILSWPETAAQDGGGSADLAGELRWESSAVLAGVMLMASGLSGHGPGAPQAALPLADLLPRIAGYRDAFYRWLFTRLPAAHRGRLEQEASRLRQPFAGVRRHINGVLAGWRARCPRPRPGCCRGSPVAWSPPDRRSISVGAIRSPRSSTSTRRPRSCSAPSAAGRRSIRGTSSACPGSFPFTSRGARACPTRGWTTLSTPPARSSTATRPPGGRPASTGPRRRPRGPPRRWSGWPAGGTGSRPRPCRA
jgi:hypothetical protein